MSRYKEASQEYRDGVKRRTAHRRLADAPRYLWAKAKRRAEKQGLEFNLDPEDIVIPERCPVLGIPIRPLSKSKNNRATLDKKDPGKGYTKGNVFVISGRANLLKNDATIDELKAIIKYMKKG